ncbi:MAG: LysE family translocator [Pseudomonadota bacterium]
MGWELTLALLGFAFASSITPGPNNMMLMASGANFGFGRSLPHLAGIGAGFALMIALVGFGLAQLFEVFPVLHWVLKIGAALYMTWFAWKIATAAPKLDAPDEVGKPFTFLQAALFQWVNPKAWAMALTVVSVYMPEALGLLAPVIVALLFQIAGVPCMVAWAVLGVGMRRFLTSAGRLRVFNGVMGALLVLSLWPILVT